MISQDDAKDHDSPQQELIPQIRTSVRAGKSPVIVAPRRFPVYPFSGNCIYTMTSIFLRAFSELQTKEIPDEEHSFHCLTSWSIALRRFVRPKRVAVRSEPERSSDPA
jgi:hypothetical protein